MTQPKKTSKPFVYRPASETQKPGYLQRRFAEIRKQQEAEKNPPPPAPPPDNLVPIKKAG